MTPPPPKGGNLTKYFPLWSTEGAHDADALAGPANLPTGAYKGRFFHCGAVKECSLGCQPQDTEHTSVPALKGRQTSTGVPSGRITDRAMFLGLYAFQNLIR